MDYEACYTIMKKFWHSYPNFPLSEDLVDIFYANFKELSPEVFARCLNEVVVQTPRFPPNHGHVMEVLREICKSDEDRMSDEEAYQVASQAVKVAVGERGRGKKALPDLLKLYPYILATVQAVRYERMAKLFRPYNAHVAGISEEEARFIRRDFLRAYREIRERSPSPIPTQLAIPSTTIPHARGINGKVQKRLGEP
jgi:hypothetical protein